MDQQQAGELLRSLDQRVERIEQILPTLSTRDETHAAIREAVAPLATRAEMHAAIREAVGPLATGAEVREEGERSRRHMEVLVESLRDDFRILAEGHVALEQRDARQHREVVKRLDAQDARLTRLEARGRRRRQ